MTRATLLIACRNRAEQLTHTLTSLDSVYGVKKPEGVQFLAVDDGSTDRTSELLRSRQSYLEVVTIERDGGYRKNPSGVLNLGHANADGDVVIEQGAEVMHLTDCITPLVEACRPGVVALARVYNGSTTEAEWIRGALLRGVYAFTEDYEPDPSRIVTNGDRLRVPRVQVGRHMIQLYCGAERLAPFLFLGAIHREDFEAVGGYDEERRDRNDEDLANRLLAHGVRFRFLGRAVAFHLKHGKS